MAQALFVTPKDIAQFTALNGNVDVDKFKQFVKISQDTHIQNFLGTDLFDKISDDIIAGTLTGNYLSLVNDHIKWMTLHWAMVEFLPFSAYSISNQGVYKHQSVNSETVDKDEVDFLINKSRSIARHYTDRFVKFMCFNSTDYPEYNSNSNDDVNPEKKVRYTNWNL